MPRMRIVICCLIAFTLTIDFSLSLISAQAYWIVTGGQKKIAGLVFGLYDASTICISPLLSIYIAKGGSYNKIFVAGIVINFIGNLLYAIADYFSSWELIFAGRVVSGLGATCVPLLMVFVADVMESDKQAKVVGYIKYIAAVSRMLGPLIGSLLTFKWDFTGTLGKLLNIFTLVGWIPMVFDLICLILLYIFSSYFVRINMDIRGNFRFQEIIQVFWPILLIGYLTTVLCWLFIGNAFLLATHHYHIINNEHDLGKIYITGLVGFVASFVMFICVRKTMLDMIWFTCSILLLSIGSCVFFFTESWAFHLGVGITTFAYGLMIPSLNIMNNNFGKQLKQYIGSYISFAISLITIAQGLARFCGPAIFILFANIIEDSNCDFSNPELYITSGCRIDNYYTQNGIYIAICTLFTVLSIIAMNKRNNQVSPFIIIKNTDNINQLINDDQYV